MMDDLFSIQKKIQSGAMTLEKVVAQVFQQMEKHRDLNAFLWADEQAVNQQAENLKSKDPATHPLFGVPVAVKDVLLTKGIPTTAGSRILEGYLPPYNATVVDRLQHAGALIVGKTNCDEFAMGASGENSAYGVTKNPHDLSRVPGGSSSGSAAAVAAGIVPVALGTDTGGSIRQPAGFCGIVGFKPTYGRVSRYGLVALASSFDQIGPMATTVKDAAVVFDVIAGHDPRDSTSYAQAFKPTVDQLDQPVQGLRIGVPKQFLPKDLDPEIRQVVLSAMQHCEKLGMKVVEVDLPNLDYALSVYYIIQPSEASANLGRYDGNRFGFGREKFGPEVKRRIMMGTYALSAGYYDAYYKRAQKVRTLIKQDFDRAFEKVDALLGPVSPSVAFPIGAKANNPLEMYLADIFTVGMNVAGLPAISLPFGTSKNLPVGIQLIAKPLDDARCLNISYQLEQSR